MYFLIKINYENYFISWVDGTTSPYSLLRNKEKLQKALFEFLVLFLLGVFMDIDFWVLQTENQTRMGGTFTGLFVHANRFPIALHVATRKWCRFLIYTSNWNWQGFFSFHVYAHTAPCISVFVSYSVTWG